MPSPVIQVVWQTVVTRNVLFQKKFSAHKRPHDLRTCSARLPCVRSASPPFEAVWSGHFHMQGSKVGPKLVQVSHSGAGTVAAAMAAGVPQVACPLLFDQPFWARPPPRLCQPQSPPVSLSPSACALARWMSACCWRRNLACAHMQDSLVDITVITIPWGHRPS